MSETKSTETMIETCVLTLGELIERNGNNKDLFKGIASKVLNPSKKELENPQYKLVIPFYQRAYVWSEEMVKIMLEDIDEQRKENEKIKADNKNKGDNEDKQNEKRYLLGSLIIHIEIDKTDENVVKFNIVDGQQRLTTLDLVLGGGLLDEADDSVVLASECNTKYKTKARETIDAWFNNRNKDEKDEFIKYLKENIEFVCVFTNSLDDAFIFFDSANAKGARLKAYDLVKAFHLRALESQNCKDLIKFYAKDFESLASKNSDDKNPPIKILFNDILAPARIWLRDRGSLANATHSTIANPQESHIYNEFCKEFSATLQTKSQPSTNSLGILQNFIGGADFFEFLAHFNRLYEKLLLTEFYENKIASIDETGFAYNRLIYIMAMMIYFDKFPNGNTDYMLRLIARAVFSLRVEASRVGEATIKNYVKEEKLLSLIYFTSYERELESELKKFIDNRKDKESGNDKRTNATEEYLKMVQEKDKNNNDEKTEYERYDIMPHPESKK
ncbi:DUF262 domain-containing protein [Helicobacter sp. MIT 01-3238]|uniref:DUF262 domain-containing protein n=1 Tax=Helicobacter sp. MIT 01-3238 TaxID=398627 RepID=UPI000E1EEC75|nr:DUF262 domain-containing protein [Helicobacter sp. MIT 01-3238]RDU51698.1 DUF262 domain-containing protein [Helicobacter sp. MIT 01-3238]